MVGTPVFVCLIGVTKNDSQLLPDGYLEHRVER